MKLLKPIDVTTSNLISTSVADGDYTTWNSGTGYTTGQYCVKGLFVYRATADNSNKDPETNSASADNLDWLSAGFLASSSPVWVVWGMLNRWRMFDSAINTQTTGTDIIVVLAPGRATDLCCFNIECNSIKIEILDGSDASVWSYEKDFIEEQSFAGMYEWLFDEFENVPQNLVVPFGWTIIGGEGEKVKVTFSGAASVGKCFPATSVFIGFTQWDLKVGHYSTAKVVDNEFGTTYLTPGKQSYPISAKVRFELNRFNFVHRVLSNTAGQAYVFSFNESDTNYGLLDCYGVISDMSSALTSYNDQQISLNIKSLI